MKNIWTYEQISLSPPVGLAIPLVDFDKSCNKVKNIDYVKMF